MNRDRMEAGIREFLEGLYEGEADIGDTEREILTNTPRRVAGAFAEDLLAGSGEDPRRHLDPIELGSVRGSVMLEDIRFSSVCAHHLLPYRGLAHVGFLPREKHVGLGGIARLVDSLARRLTLQESLTSEIADHIDAILSPRAVVVVTEAEHLCLSVRGARKTGHRFVSIESRGESSPDLDSLAARVNRGN